MISSWCRHEKCLIGLFCGHRSGQFKEETRTHSLSESRKGPLLILDRVRPHLADQEIQASNLTWLSYAAYSPDLAPVDFWLFGHLTVTLEKSSFETAEELQEKVTDILMSIPTSTFRAVFEEWKSRLLRYMKQVESIFTNTPSQRYPYITRRDKPWGRTFGTAYLGGP
jgi:hypothetical protein